MAENPTQIASGVSKKTGEVWYAIVAYRPSYTFIDKQTFDLLASAGATVLPARSSK